MRIRGAWVRYNEQACVADRLRLWSKRRLSIAMQREQQKWSEGGESVKARDARRVVHQFLNQMWDPLLEVGRLQLRRIRRWTFDHVSESHAEANQIDILLWSE